MVDGIFQLLLDHIADHAFGLGAQHIQRVGTIGAVGCALQGQQTDLRPIAMGNHQLMPLTDQFRQRGSSRAHIGPLSFGSHGLPALEQSIATQGDDDQHASLRGWQPEPP